MRSSFHFHTPHRKLLLAFFTFTSETHYLLSPDLLLLLFFHLLRKELHIYFRLIFCSFTSETHSVTFFIHTSFLLVLLNSSSFLFVVFVLFFFCFPPHLPPKSCHSIHALPPFSFVFFFFNLPPKSSHSLDVLPSKASGDPSLPRWHLV